MTQSLRRAPGVRVHVLPATATLHTDKAVNPDRYFMCQERPRRSFHPPTTRSNSSAPRPVKIP